MWFLAGEGAAELAAVMQKRTQLLFASPRGVVGVAVYGRLSQV